MYLIKTSWQVRHEDGKNMSLQKSYKLKPIMKTHFLPYSGIILSDFSLSNFILIVLKK